jgi:hypothetical protein
MLTTALAPAFAYLNDAFSALASAFTDVLTNLYDAAFAHLNQFKDAVVLQLTPVIEFSKDVSLWFIELIALTSTVTAAISPFSKPLIGPYVVEVVKYLLTYQFKKSMYPFLAEHLASVLSLYIYEFWFATNFFMIFSCLIAWKSIQFIYFKCRR